MFWYLFVFFCRIERNGIKYNEEIKKEWKMKEILTSIDMDAPVELAWEVLIDFASYPLWNPVLPRIDGKPAVNETITVFFKTSTPLAVPIHFLKIYECQPRQELAWYGPIVPPFIEFFGRGDHYFRLVKIAYHHTRLIHGEVFSGVIAEASWQWWQENLEWQYQKINHAFQKRVEFLSIS